VNEKKPKQEAEPNEDSVVDETSVENVEEPQEPKNEPLNSNPGLYVHTFRKPFKHEGKTFKTMNFYFEDLTGKDMINIENEMSANGAYALAPEISRIFQCLMASKAGKIGDDVLQELPFKDFNKITNAARDFLIESSGE